MDFLFPLLIGLVIGWHWNHFHAIANTYSLRKEAQEMNAEAKEHLKAAINARKKANDVFFENDPKENVALFLEFCERHNCPVFFLIGNSGPGKNTMMDVGVYAKNEFELLEAIALAKENPAANEFLQIIATYYTKTITDQ